MLTSTPYKRSAPSKPTHDELMDRYGIPFAVLNPMLTSVEDRASAKAWLDAAVEGDIRPWPLDEYIPTNLPTVEAVSAPVTVAQPVLAPAPTPALEAAPVAALAAPMVEVEEAGTPWEARFTEVHVDVFKRYTPEYVTAIIKLRRMVSRERGDIYTTPERLEKVLGVDRKVAKRWLSPGGRIASDVWLRTNEDGELDFEHLNPNTGELCWRIDVRPINLVDVIDEDGEPVKDARGRVKRTPATPEDRYTQAPHTWLWQHPDTTGGDEWTRREDTTDGAVWAAGFARGWAAGRVGVALSVPAMARNSVIAERTIKRHLGDAEKAGLMTVTGSRAGHHAAFRRTHTTPVAEDVRTTGSRVRKSTGTPAHTVEPIGTPVEPDLPF